MKQILKSMTLGAAIGVATMFGRGDTSAQKLPSTNKAAIVKSFKSNPSEHEIKKIIINPSSYPFRGWKESNPLKEPLYLDFFKTQKNKGDMYYSIGFGEEGGEAASYKLKNNKLYITINNFDGKPPRTEIYTVKIKKGKTPKEDQLILNNKIFKRNY